MDAWLSRLARRLGPGDDLSEAVAGFRLLEIDADELDRLAARANALGPALRTHDRQGEPLGALDIDPAYRTLEDVAYGDLALVSRPLARWREGEGKPWARSISFALGEAFSRVEQGLYCPLCMTDGAAVVLRQTGDAALWARMGERLGGRARDRWTGAMFLTERQGGSDVGAAAAVAVRDPESEGGWRLHGEKWFCSNAGADVALVLARPEGAPAGTRGLGLFAMPRLWPDGRPNTYRLRRLKDKLGTRSMATAEVELGGASAWAVGPLESGFAQMAVMINLSRLYNAVASSGIMGRALAEVTDWARSRTAFGKPLVAHPLVARQLEILTAEREAAASLIFMVVGALDRVESGAAEPGDAGLVRLFTPLLKMNTARRAVWAASEAIELLGGNGYVEEWVTARLLRDAQVLPVWEGASNMQVHDLVRVLTRADGVTVLERWATEGLDRLASSTAPRGQALGAALREDWLALQRALHAWLPAAAEDEGVRAREWVEQIYPWAGALALALEGLDESVRSAEEALAACGWIGRAEAGMGDKLFRLAGVVRERIPWRGPALAVGLA
ncbi:MAG: acyl-CoA dehydrogenase family protein [Candidatus Sericytochromatia bacterium]|nr:acyl-CoA dehydrogenase family protein [Candidatus Sericytochromatia bacterium]